LQAVPQLTAPPGPPSPQVLAVPPDRVVLAMVCSTFLVYPVGEAFISQTMPQWPVPPKGVTLKTSP
jgi:hypothetical protein